MAKAKKIIAIVSLSLVGVLILATLILSVINVEHKICFNNPEFIDVYYGNVNYSKRNPASIQKNRDEERYNKVLEYLNGSSKEKALNALFNGSLFKKPEIVVDSASRLTDIPTSASSNSFFVYLGYNTPQVLKDGNNNYQLDGKDYYYRGLCFEITADEVKMDVSIYVVPYYSVNSDSEYEYPSTSNLKYQVKYVFSAEFSPLYNYLKELRYDK